MACWCKGKCPNVGAARELAKAGKMGRAHLALRNALSTAPLCVEGNLMLAGLLCRTNHATAALVHIERAAQQEGETVRLKYERATTLRAASRLVEATAEFRAALELAPDNASVTAGLLGAVEMAGTKDEAGALATAARARFPDNADIRRLAAIIADARGDTVEAANMLATPGVTAVELLDLGRYQDKLGEHAAAWSSWEAGKAMARDKGHVYNAAPFEKFAGRLMASADPPRPFFVRRAPELETDPAPLFICGFPRSGTTMLETVLSCHSAIIAGDELSGISDVIENLSAWLRVRLPYPESMIAASLGENAGVPALLRDYYLSLAQERVRFSSGPRRAGKSRRKPFFFTDKMPLNELHLPLVRMLFPAAPIVRLVRHPLDVMVSCMANWLPHGGYYASSLEACATHYSLVDSVAEHYKKAFIALDRPGFRDLRYEDFIADPAAHTRDLLAYAGLDMEPRCLSPHKNPRLSRTLSYRQVQQPLNDKSVGRWKNYRAQLAPAVEILRPILERGGYEF